MRATHPTILCFAAWVIVAAGAPAGAQTGAPAAGAQPAGSGRVEVGALNLSDGSAITFGLFVPRDDNRATPRPLVLALHPGGARTPDYGPRFLDEIVQPGLEELGAIAIAPNCPAESWTDPAAERAVLALVEQVRREYAIDPLRITVVGFSMGGRGTWALAARHPQLFTAAIAMAATPGDEPVETLGRIPTYVIHSRDDEVVSFERAEQVVRELERLKRPVEFRALAGFGHFEMLEYVEPLRRAADWVARQWQRPAGRAR